MTLEHPFHRGDLVVAVLHSPRERIWGALLGLETSGITLRGVELRPWDEILSQVRRGEGDQVSLSTRFIPLARLESMYVDEPSSGVPSLSQVFRERTGMEPLTFLFSTEAPSDEG